MMTLNEFDDLPTIMSQFPLTYDMGNQRWTSFIVRCNDCGRDVSVEQTRGFVDRETIPMGYRGQRVIDHKVTAYALCQHCNTLTTAKYVLHEDMTFTGSTGKRYHMRKTTKWEKAVNRLKAWWKGTDL